MATKKLLITILILCATPLLMAQEHFNKGVQAFEEGEFENATNYFHAHVEDFPLDYVGYYNLGNAYYKQKKYPHALWAYEKTLKINPRYNDAIFNAKLSYDRAGLVGEWKHSTSMISQLLFGVQKNAWAIITLLFSSTLAITLFLMFTTTRVTLKRILFLVTGICIFIVSTALILALMHKSHLTTENKGVIIIATANAKVAPNSESRTLFSIPGGQKVQLLREQEDWIEVQISAENVGWLKKEDLRKF